MYVKFVLALSLLVCSVIGEDTETDEVLVLTTDNFQSAISEHEFLLVEFYAPWCGHCKALAPEYSKAAKQLKDDGSAIKLGKVDATEHTKLAEEYGIKGYPTLKFFRSGAHIEYSGGRNSDGIVNWLLKKTGPAAKVLKTLEELKEFTKETSVNIVGFFKDVESEQAKEFERAAQALDDYPFAITSEESLMKEHEVDEAGIILFKSFDEGKAVFEGEIKEKEILTFISGNSLPIVVDFDHETAAKIFGGEIKSHLLIFISKEANHYEQYLDVAKAVAKKYKGKLLFVTINTDEEDHARILEFFGMDKKEVPGLRIIKLEEDMAKYKPESYDMTEENLSSFVQNFLDGKLKQHLLAQDLPEDWNSKPVKVLVASNFEEIAMDKEKDVLVEFYAPWCGHCKQLAPIYDELGEKFEDDESIVIAKIDATVNELESIKIQSFPTLKLFKKETNEVIDYRGKRTLEALVEFIEGNSGEGEGEDEEEEEEEDEDEDTKPKDEL